MKKLLWWTTLVCRYKNTNFKDTLILCSFSRILVVGYPRGLWAPQLWLLTKFTFWLRRLTDILEIWLFGHVHCSTGHSQAHPLLSPLLQSSASEGLDQQACFMLIPSYSFFRVQLALSTLVRVQLVVFHQFVEIDYLPVLPVWSLNSFKIFMAALLFSCFVYLCEF